MATITGLMNLARQALDADQEALSVTANNVSNQNTAGYTREVVSFQDGATVSLSGGVTTNTGVTTTVQSQRDRVLEQSVQQQTQVSSAATTLSSALSQLESLVGITATSGNAASSTLGSAIDGLFSSFQSLAADPGSAAAQQAVVSAGNTLTSAFQTISNSAAQLSSQVAGEVTSSVPQVNALLNTLGTLNGQIASLGSTQDAGTLEDQRQETLAQLSQLISFQQSTSENGSITLTTENGSLLVSGTSVQPISATQNGVSATVYDSQGNTITGITGGSIGGELSALNDIQTFQGSLNTLATGLATAINTQNAAGLTSSGTAGGSLISWTPPNAAATMTFSTDPTAIATAGVGEGAGGTTNINALSAVANSNSVNGQTPSAAYASFVAQTGNTASAAASDATVQQSALTQVTTQRNSLSSVSLDEEAANLTQYQRSYQAAARIFSIVDELLAAAINLGTETAVQ